MSVKETTVDSKVETLDINLDEIFDAAPSGSDITLPNETKSKPKITESNAVNGIPND